MNMVEMLKRPARKKCFRCHNLKSVTAFGVGRKTCIACLAQKKDKDVREEANRKKRAARAAKTHEKAEQIRQTHILLLGDIRKEFFEFGAKDPSGRWRIDAALAHVIKLAYEKGLRDAK